MEKQRKPKYLLVIDYPQRKEFVPFYSFWALCLRIRDLRAQGIECHIAK